MEGAFYSRTNISIPLFFYRSTVCYTSTMNNRIYIFSGIILTLVLSALGYLLYTTVNAPIVLAPTISDIPLTTTTEVASVAPVLPVTSETAATRITVDTPLPETIARSPLTVSGNARGNWYFEASFPIMLVDANGVTLAQVPAQAQGDWMTDDFVPFNTILTWSSTSTVATSGVLILKRDNPSGLPEYDDSIAIPVLLQ
ncbi:MAG: hypothetical protein A2845_05300 [Candidatus Lloydbacteria bacterium RIFCSPHIGHO2_01_FULL_49_22]|uniref:Bacterial spore germination immunoglobulin-like domain-containing protein n=1 Tax=Candidatus Lloydbacteria bacterium RIFCSPHIGHO2_01_FULL_49_22 TaxID=1798658 RepID=A0A1G2CVJ3_9BACT|nr:MAG: hypothetical protein A2845_05300 [Candidatus Lloydbacteria bacterium RIFCSPHIGHO2_01_FULL_49_22]